ncbi:MAG: hypothetical protein U0414_27790 [Polyangiaceae bacterium]
MVPAPELGGTSFQGAGLVNFQNGFLRCVRCIGILSADGTRCDAAPDQLGHRAARFDDGRYDLDTGTCESNLAPGSEFFETYFPVGALDASRGFVKAPDAIIDTRSARQRRRSHVHLRARPAARAPAQRQPGAPFPGVPPT